MTAVVPHYAMSGGTLIAFAADEVVAAAHSVLGPDPQLGEYPRASIVAAAGQPGSHEARTLMLARATPRRWASPYASAGAVAPDRPRTRSRPQDAPRVGPIVKPVG